MREPVLCHNLHFGWKRKTLLGCYARVCPLEMACQIGLAASMVLRLWESSNGTADTTSRRVGQSVSQSVSQSVRQPVRQAVSQAGSQSVLPWMAPLFCSQATLIGTPGRHKQVAHGVLLAAGESLHRAGGKRPEEARHGCGLLWPPGKTPDLVVF